MSQTAMYESIQEQIDAITEHLERIDIDDPAGPHGYNDHTWLVQEREALRLQKHHLHEAIIMEGEQKQIFTSIERNDIHDS